MMYTGNRTIKNNNFNFEKEYNIIIKLIDENKNINIDLANRIFSKLIEKNNKSDIISFFNKIKTYLNETTYSLMVKYYSEINQINEAQDLLNKMEKKNIKIKKRTLLPLFNKLCNNKDLENAIIIFRKYIKKKYQLEIKDFYCILKLVLTKNKNIKTIFKSMKRNISEIDENLVSIIKNPDNKITYELCNVEKGLCNGVKLKSIDLKQSEIDIILNNIETNYAKDKKNDILKYKEFLDNNKKFNILLDGANIMFFIDRKISINGYNRLNTIYKHMLETGKYPLVILHQRHYDYLDKSGLSKNDIDKVKEIYKKWENEGNLYLTPHKMNDDWFFLYGSVYKKNCMVITNDHLRDHIFKISEKTIHNDILKKWIDRRVIRYNFKYQDYINTKTLKLKFPLEYSKKIQKIKSDWYFPINNKWIIVTDL